MAREERGGSVYYYASRRVGQRVRKIYLGAGPAGEQAATERTQWRLARNRQQERLAEVAAVWHEAEDWRAAADRVVAAALEACGWHRVRRQWRRKRGAAVGTQQRADGAGWDGTDLLRAAGLLAPGVAERAKAGDRAALAEVDEYLARPSARALYGDLGRHVLTKWAVLYGGADPVLRRGVLRHAADLRERLAGPAPTALVELVAERVVLAWLAVGWCEYQMVSLMAELDVAALDAHGRRVERAHRMLLAACRTLAKVRCAGLPEVLAVVNVPPTGASRAGDSCPTRACG